LRSRCRADRARASAPGRPFAAFQDQPRKASHRPPNADFFTVQARVPRGQSSAGGRPGYLEADTAGDQSSICHALGRSTRRSAKAQKNRQDRIKKPRISPRCRSPSVRHVSCARSGSGTRPRRALTAGGVDRARPRPCRARSKHRRRTWQSHDQSTIDGCKIKNGLAPRKVRNVPAGVLARAHLAAGAVSDTRSTTERRTTATVKR